MWGQCGRWGRHKGLVGWGGARAMTRHQAWDMRTASAMQVCDMPEKNLTQVHMRGRSSLPAAVHAVQGAAVQFGCLEKRQAASM